MENLRDTLIVVCGPTASGKTAASIELCKKINGEIVSADSMQIYKGMNIGTAKPTAAEQQAVKHYMLDVFDPSEKADVSKYCTLAQQAISEIRNKGKEPVLCGGTGLYIDAVTKPMRFSAPGDENMRAELKRIAERENGRTILHDMLSELDEEAAHRLHENDVRRVIRAIESFRLTGKTQVQLAEEESKLQGNYREIVFGLQMDREKLYDRINKRVDAMVREGLIDEVADLLKRQDASGETAMQAIGYKEIAEAFEGKCSMDEAIDRIKQASRNYAKRQMTWLRRDKRVRFIEVDNMCAYEIADHIEDICRKEGYLK